MESTFNPTWAKCNTLAAVMISSAILAFLASVSVGRVRVRMVWNDMLLKRVVYGDVEMRES